MTEPGAAQAARSTDRPTLAMAREFSARLLDALADDEVDVAFTLAEELDLELTSADEELRR